MKNALSVIAVFCAVALLSVPVEAAERYLGTVVVMDAGVVHNLFPVDGGAFYIAPNSLITVQPSAAAYICVDELTSTRTPTCSATLGVKVAADTAFPSSCRPSQASLQVDGGMVVSCVVSCMPVTGSSVSCAAWDRRGNEF